MADSADRAASRAPGERVAVVTGGSSGIGRATVEALVKDGLRVASLDLAPGDGAAELEVPVDVADEASVAAAIDRVLAVFGRVDVLVNNAGITGSAAATVLHETPVEDWDRVFGVNVRGVFLGTRAVLPAMLAQGSGHVITVASSAGLVAFPRRCAYTASKGAALMLAKSVAVDYAAAGIRSNAVCPGFVQTPMTQWRLDVPELRAKVESAIPMGRVAQPEEIADAIAVLASERLGYVTGHALLVDGGWTAL
jgi:NAD(P)-dependent dehydrogenase (short-subunit alcohol dehydrogenase family)